MIPTDRTGTARAVLAVCTVFELRPGETDSRIPGAWKFARNAAAAKRRPAHRPEAAAYRVCVDKPPQSQTLPGTHDTPVLENDILRAEITPDGKLNLLHKAGGRWYRDVLTLEDTADTGHSYISLPLAGDAPVGPGEPVSMKYTRDAVCQEAVLSFLMRLPEALNEDRTARSSRLVACPVTLTLRLHAGEPFLRASWQIENRARDHRLRMLVRTGLNADATTALSPFDLVQHRRSELDVRLCSESRHNSGMVSLSDGAAGFSVLNSGAYSYENLQAQPGTLALTLLRATARIWPEAGADWPEDDAWHAEENQCLRTICIDTALYPHSGEEQARFCCDCL